MSLFSEQIDVIAERVQRLDQILIADFEGADGDMRSLIESQRGKLSAVHSDSAIPCDIDAYRQSRRNLSQHLFAAEDAQWERRRPYRRALAALETYQAGLTDLVSTVPEQVLVEGTMRYELLQQYGIGGWRLHFSRLRRGTTMLPLRKLLARGVRTRLLRFSRAEGLFFLGMASSLRRLRLAWEIARTDLDSAVAGKPRPARELEVLWRELGGRGESIEDLSISALTVVREWSAQNVSGLVSEIAGGLRTGWEGPFDFRSLWPERQDHFVRQMQSAEAELRLERGLLEFEDRVLALASGMLGNIGDERKALLQELEEAASWCEGMARTKKQESLARGRADLVPIHSRLHDFELVVWAQLTVLPDAVRVLPRLRASPPRRRPHWQTLAPRNNFRSTYRRTGYPGLSKALEEVGTEHRRIVREVERAREVVAFGQETAAADQDTQIAEEAVRNALSLLQYARQHARDWRDAVVPRVSATLASVFVENRLLLRERKLGVLVYLTQEGFRRAPRLVGKAVYQALRHAMRTGGQGAGMLAGRFLVAIGWRAAPVSEETEVVTRPFLPAEFTVDLSAKELPAIYRRLFRFTPVEDPRFLVGREDELRALAETRGLWQQGRPVSAIIVGRRGSGKTSLINCAIRRGLEDLPVIRGEFSERVTTAPEIRLFLAKLAGLTDPEDLERFLRSERRVFIVEELERTFLRQVGCYGAVRELQRLISATCASTLWVLATNEIAFRFLDATVGLGNSFSHRINASTASREDLRQAVLLRHNLSGLRLQFTPLPPPIRATDRLRQRFESDGDPEKMFFDALARESSGVFRTAFEIWLGQIDHSTGGALYMKPLQDVDLSAVVRDLEMKDLITLVAVLQHGSLTSEEHARIFQKSLEASRAQVDELMAREIVEPDPTRTGFRVRPEAMRVVLEALYRSNLL
jgi:hypothetical protein